MSHSKRTVSCSVASIVALLFVPFGVVSADFINFANPTAMGAEDTAIPLGITVDPALLEGGSQLDIIGSAAGFRDATAGMTPNTFAIPMGAAFVRITGMGGLDNASSSNAKDEEFQLTTITVDLAAQTYSGHTAYVVDQYNGNGNYVFTDVALGAASDSGDIVGHNLFSANSIIVSASDSLLSISESQSRLDQAYLVEFLANEASSSNYLGAEWVRPSLQAQSPIR